MTILIEAVITSYDRYFTEMSDKRTIDWPLMRSPLPIIAIVVFYIWFVKKAGPYVMKSKEPFKIDRLIQAYDLVQSIFCLIMATFACVRFYGPSGVYNLACEPLDFSDNPENRITLTLCYIYFSLKLVDLFHTIFFVLQKKYWHITSLHVYHHSTQVIMSWWSLRFIPGGHGVFFGVIDTYIHAFWYFYWYLSNKMKTDRYVVLLKKYMCLLTMVYYLAILGHSLQMVFITDCDFPKLPVIFFLPNSVIYLYSLVKFYQKAYLTKKEL